VTESRTEEMKAGTSFEKFLESTDELLIQGLFSYQVGHLGVALHHMEFHLKPGLQ